MLKLENLTIRFGGLTAVDNVTTHVEQGEIFGLVGPNGLRYKLKKLSSTSLR